MSEKVPEIGWNVASTEVLLERLHAGDLKAIVSARDAYRRVVSAITDIQHALNDIEPPADSPVRADFDALMQTKWELEQILKKYDPGYLEEN